MPSLRSTPVPLADPARYLGSPRPKEGAAVATRLSRAGDESRTHLDLVTSEVPSHESYASISIEHPRG